MILGVETYTDSTFSYERSAETLQKVRSKTSASLSAADLDNIKQESKGDDA